MVSIPFKRESVSQVTDVYFNHNKSINVSIPFKRESVSQVESEYPLWNKGRSFHSLQTGKRITSEFNDFLPGKVYFLFQFPSNGKAYHK